MTILTFLCNIPLKSEYWFSFITEHKSLLFITAFHPYTQTPVNKKLQVFASKSVKLGEGAKECSLGGRPVLKFCKNSGGTEGTEELPSAIRASAVCLYNLPQCLSTVEWIGHSNLLGSGGPCTEAAKRRFGFLWSPPSVSSLASN